MKNAMCTLKRRLPRLKLAAALLFASQAWAGALDIATYPIATGAGQAVKPNLYFILDDSGSMNSDYTPDYVNDSICQNSLSSYGNTHNCTSGSSSNKADPPYMAGDFNKQYYNPAIRYYPPKKYDGTEWGNADPENAITGDIFRGSTSDTNLKTDYPDAYWCKTSGDAAPGPDCHNNEGTRYGYGYPNNVWSVQKNVNGAPFYYVLSGSPTWCSDKSLTTCQAKRTATYQYPRFSDPVTATAGSPFTPAVAATRAKVTITVSKVTSGSKIDNVKCGKDSTGATAFPGTYTLPDGNNSTLASWLAGKLTACSNPAAGAWVITYPSASGNNNEIDVSWPVAGAAGNGNKFYIEIDTNSGSGFTVRIGGSDIDASSQSLPLSGYTLSGGADAAAAIPAVADVITFPTAGVQFNKIVIDPAVTSYTRGSKRTDCTASTDSCNYAEELQNFANWYQYYRTRMLMMKTSVSRVFAGVTDVAPGAGLRVGFDVISNTASTVTQSVADFTTGATGNKKTFFDNLYAANPSSYTPLRGALSKAGRMYAGKLSVDPMQLSCQQNFTFLSTDGYWNTNIETSTYGPYKENNTDLVGNQDFGDTAATASSASLSVDTVNSGAYTITQIKCGTGGGSVSTINETYTVSGATGTERRANMAAWLATKLTQCTNPAVGAWQITYSGGTSNTIQISWPITGATGNGQAFYLAIKVSSTANIVTKLGGTTVSLLSIPNPVTTFANLSGGANATTGVDRPFYDAAGASNTLADIAMYYWKNDLRTMTNDVKPSTRDPATWQHMTTFTMGLGIDGLLSYAVDYETGGSADYTALLNGTKDWPDPITNTTDERVDDLWHAAVNGHGQYFSASRPDEVVEQIEMAIASITAETGAGSGAATSALEPTQGDNYAYTASFRTQFWNGDLQAREIYLKDDPATATVEAPGSLKEAASWSAAYKLGSQPSRTLYTFNAAAVGTDKKLVLSWTNLPVLGAAYQGYFNPAQLYQCTPIALCPGATAENLFNFLMGGADTTTNTSYRNRESVGDPTNVSNPAVVNILGDLVNSQPVFVGKPNLTYTENGYVTFKGGAAATRGRTVYVGSNDGFLHAFNADTGVERWAYMPKVHLQNLWKIAGTNYQHDFYQDGAISVTDAYDGSAWRTILVSGMNKGGKYYFGLDVTDPTAVKALWEFSDATTSGYAYGNPIVTKLPAGATDSGGNDVAGRWVVLVTSGYNNTGGDGQGVLYVLDAFTGQKLFEMTTTSSLATSASPAGLAKINAWADNPATDNTAKWVYGGDLNGDLWRFDLATKGVLKVAALGEPVTVRPALGEIDGSRVLFLGTGLFLQEADKSDDSQRTIFAIKDTGVTQTALKTNGNYVQQTLTNKGDYRIVTNNAVDWSAKNGWFVNLPDARERVNLDPKLVLGTLIVPSNVPDATSTSSCSAGGYSWKNQLDWKTGSAVETAEKDADGNRKSGTKDESLLVGFAVIVVDQDVRFVGTTADNKIEPEKVNVGGSGSTSIRRISWREIITE